MIRYRDDHVPALDEARELYRASTLGERRPIDDDARFAAMLANANLTITAWDGDMLVGIARSLSDFAWTTYLADLAVRVSHQRHGIGKALMERTQAAAPQAKIVLYHAYESAYAGIAGRTAQGRTAHTHGVHEAQAFLDRCALAPEDRARIRVVVESGAVELAASRYVRDHGIQLAVAGNRGISGIGDLLLGSSAAKLLQWVPCDLLLVRAQG